MQVDALTIKQERYADTIRMYLVKPDAEDDMTEKEIKAAVIERFAVGENWYDNKLELFRPNHDGSAYTVKIREPYLD